MATSSPLDHELKIGRALTHLQNLQGEVGRWLNGDHHSVRQETNPQTGEVTFLASAEQPPANPFGLLIGDCVHNLRAGLDNLAFALAGAFTSPLPNDFAESSEFPIFGDEDRQGNTGVGASRFSQRTNRGDSARSSGLYKIRGWDPQAQAIVEGLQPYHRGNAFRTDSLWILHELDRIDKHRLLHAVVASFFGVELNTARSINVSGWHAGVIHSFEGMIETDTPIAVFPGFIPLDTGREMHVEIQPTLDIAFAQGTRCVDNESVLKTLWSIHSYVEGTVFAKLRPFL